MIKPTYLKFLVVLFSLFASVTPTLSAEISGPTLTMKDNDIFVSTGLSYLGELESMIESGIEKKIVFTIELFRVWNFWPDEFVASRRIKKTIRYDNLRGLYYVTVSDGTVRVVKKFKDFHEMKTWAFKVNDINIANVRELEYGRYYLRVVVESKSKKLPPVIGILMIFIPEVEMIMAKESEPFSIGDFE
jgi:hypothetical protein